MVTPPSPDCWPTTEAGSQSIPARKSTRRLCRNIQSLQGNFVEAQYITDLSAFQYRRIRFQIMAGRSRRRVGRPPGTRQRGVHHFALAVQPEHADGKAHEEHMD